MPDNDHDLLFAGLTALAATAFPKRCGNCGRVFESAEQFLTETRAIVPDRSGLKSAQDDDGRTIVELFRNCPCGSTLLDYFSDRRDLSPTGERRRQQFGKLLAMLVAEGMERDKTRAELLKVLRGEDSELLARFRKPR